MVNGQLDAVGNQDPPYSMVFSGLSNNCRIALRLALNISDAVSYTHLDLAAGGHGPEAVFLRAAQVLQRVLTAARVQRVAVRQEGLAPLLLAQRLSLTRQVAATR